jgi:hypothetical protein
MEEGQHGLRIATRADPTLDRRPRPGRYPARENIGDSVCLRHEVLLPASRARLGVEPATRKDDNAIGGGVIGAQDETERERSSETCFGYVG